MVFFNRHIMHHHSDESLALGPTTTPDAGSRRGLELKTTSTLTPNTHDHTRHTPLHPAIGLSPPWPLTRPATMAAAYPPGGTYFDGKESFADVPIDAAKGNAIATTEFLQAAEALTNLFDVLGSAAFKPVKSDMAGNIKVQHTAWLVEIMIGC